MTSEGAKGGFENERELIASFNSFEPVIFPIIDALGHNLKDIGRLEASKAPPRIKPDILLKVYSKQGHLIAEEALSAKLQSSSRGFNQIDRGDIENRYRRLWPQMSDDAATGLKLFTGILPPVGVTRNRKRMFMDEIDQHLRSAVLDFFTNNLREVATDVLAGRGSERAKSLLVSDSSSNTLSVVPMEKVIDAAIQGGVGLTPKFSLRLGQLTAQRKGGDGGAESAKNLQFKVNPADLLSGYMSSIAGIA